MWSNLETFFHALVGVSSCHVVLLNMVVFGFLYHLCYAYAQRIRSLDRSDSQNLRNPKFPIEKIAYRIQAFAVRISLFCIHQLQCFLYGICNGCPLNLPMIPSGNHHQKLQHLHRPPGYMIDPNHQNHIETMPWAFAPTFSLYLGRFAHPILATPNHEPIITYQSKSNLLYLQLLTYISISFKCHRYTVWGIVQWCMTPGYARCKYYNISTWSIVV